MSNKEFLEIFDGIDEKYVEEAKDVLSEPIYSSEVQPVKSSPKKYIFVNVLKTAACAAVVCAIAVPVLILSGKGNGSQTLKTHDPIINAKEETDAAAYESADTEAVSVTDTLTAAISDTGPNAVSVNTAAKEPPTAEDTPSAAAETAYETLIDVTQGFFNGQLVCYHNGHYRCVTPYTRGSYADSFAQYVNGFAESLGEQVKTYVMIAPTSSEFYIPDVYSEDNASQYEDILSIANSLGGKVTHIDCVQALRGHIDEEIYFRTDHHWQALGAYYAAREFAEAADVPFYNLDAYEKREIEGYTGALYGITQCSELLDDPETFTYYVPSHGFDCYYYDSAYNFDRKSSFFAEMPVSSSYATYMGGDDKIVRIETDVKNGRRLAVFKDSFGNAEIPFLSGSFEEIFVCDIRYFDLNAAEFIRDRGITDVLFTVNTFSATGYNCEHIEKICAHHGASSVPAETASTSAGCYGDEPYAHHTEEPCYTQSSGHHYEGGHHGGNHHR